MLQIELQENIAIELDKYFQPASSPLSKRGLKQNHKWRVCSYHDLPPWMQNNEYLKHGHRPPLYLFSSCFWSIFRWHTETGNIWTHALAFLLFVCMSTNYLPNFLLKQTYDKLVFYCFFTGSIICFLMSTLFHTLSCHSSHISTFFARIDYCGICCQIFASAVPLIYFRYEFILIVIMMM